MEDDGGGRPVCEGGQDDFVARTDAEGGECHVEGACAAIDYDAMLYADEIGEFFLQCLALRSENAVEDVGVEYGHDGVTVRLREGRPRLDEAVWNCFFAAKDCESFHGLCLVENICYRLLFVQVIGRL